NETSTQTLHPAIGKMVWHQPCGPPSRITLGQLQFELSGSLGINMSAVILSTIGCAWDSDQTRGLAGYCRQAHSQRSGVAAGGDRLCIKCTQRPVLQFCRSVAVLLHSEIFEISYLVQSVSRCPLRARSLFACRPRSRVKLGSALFRPRRSRSMKRVGTADMTI